jgi:hypothetical protein
VAVLVILSPIALLFWQFYTGARDMRHANDEFKRTVNPDELRTWVCSQVTKHPDGGYLDAEADWPETFPRFSGSRGVRMYLYPSNENPTPLDTLCAYLVWDFSGGYALKVSVQVNPDGTPVDVDDREPWAKGITFDFLAR